MPERETRVPGPDHPIAVERDPRRVRVTVGGRVIADSTASLALREADYPVVHYVPRADVDMAALERSDRKSWCPYKGEASYFSIPAGGERARNAVWSYEDPHAGVDAIRDHLAFYADRVDDLSVA